MGTPASNPTKPDAPTFGSGGDVDTLGAAGLDAPVRLLEPSWSHFLEKAMVDDVAGSHMLVSTPPEVHFTWDTTAYNSNETVYLGDEDCTLVIDKVSFPPDANGYTATIVAKGDVRIDASNGTNWFVDTNQTLNIIAGKDIRRTTTGFMLASSENCAFHFYAGHDIEMRDMAWKAAGVHEFYGSFTAGNRVYFESPYTLWQWTTFKWSRWGLDPVGWTPSFTVQSWREI